MQIEIPVSKRKLIISMLGCLAFIAAGVLFITTPGSFARGTLFKTPAMIVTVGVLSILFFGFCGYFIGKKIASKTPGLIITERGITDNSSGFSGHTILWRDISEVGSMKIFRQSFVTLKVKNADEYINAEVRPAVRKAMQMNLRTAGTPFCISANTLGIRFKKLLTLLQEKHRANGEVTTLS